MASQATMANSAAPALSLDNLNIQTFLNLVLRDLEREPRLAVSVWAMGLTIFYLLYLLSRKSYDPKQQRRLTKHEEETLISEWRPLALTPALPELLRKRKAPVVESAVGAYVAVEGKRYLNFSSTNFLGIANSREIKDAALKAVDKYGVGSCGPRGFYGSIDVHLHLEAAIAKFYGVDHCILYSDGFAAISTSLPPFAKKGDLLVVDEGANFAIQTAANLSRANIVWFKHNDMKDLEAKLQEIKKKDERKGVKKPYPRFIVVEGLYQYTGEICNLKQVVALAQQYKYRMYVDDSLALGVLGKTGRGSLEHWNIPASEIDLLCAALDNSVAAVGGFCVGTKHAVDHQRLSASGYCFSASAPPYCSTAAIAALSLIDEKPQLSSSVRQKAARMRKGLDGIKGVAISGDQASPVIHIRLSPSRGVDKDTEIMERVAQQLISSMVLVHVSQYVPADHRPPAPSLKVLVSACHADGDIDSTADMIKFAFGSLRL